MPESIAAEQARIRPQLIDRVLAFELKGEARITYDSIDIVCEIDAPPSAEWEEALQE